MSTSSSPSIGRKRVRRIAVFFCAMAVLYLGASFVLSRFLDPEALATWLEPRLEQALSRDVEVDRVEVGFLPLAVRLQEVTVADPTGLAPFLAQVGSLEFRAEILPLFRREVRVSRLSVEGLRIDLRVGQEGKSNFGDFSTRSTSDSTSQATAGAEEAAADNRQPFALDLRSVRLSDGQLRFSNASTTSGPFTARMGSMGLRATVRKDDDGRWVVVGTSDGGLTLRRGEAPSLIKDVPLELAFDLESDSGFEQLRVRTGELRLGDMALALSGEVDHFQDPVRSVLLDVQGEGLPLRNLLTALPDSIRNRIPEESEGWLAVDLRVEGEAGPGSVPTVTGRVALTQGRFTLGGNPLADALTADLEFTPDRSVQTRAQATILDGPFSIEGRVDLGAGGNMDLVLSATPDLGRIGSLIELPEGVTAAGLIDGQVRVTGPMGDPESLRLNGEVRATGVKLTHPKLGVPVEVSQGEVKIEGIRAIVQELPVSLGEDRISLTGELVDLFALVDPEAVPRLRGSISGARLDLGRLSVRPLADSTLTYGKVAFAKVGGRSLGSRAFEEAARELGLARPASLPLAGSLQLAMDTVIERQGRMENVRARVDFGPSFLRVSEATFRRYGGNIRTAANLTLGPDNAAPFSLSLQLQDLDAGSFLSQNTLLGQLVRGRITFELDLIGTLDGLLLPDRPALVGSGSFALSDGGLATTPLTQGLADFLGLEPLREPSIQDWATSFLLEDGRVRLAEATVQGAPGTPRVGGSIGLDGELDLQSVFTLPVEGLDASALERLGIAGEIAAGVAQRPELVQAILRIGGSAFDPAIRADPEATARTLGEAVQKEVESEVQEQIEEQKQQLQGRAAGFLRNLIQGRDTATIPPPPDTIQIDSLLPDSLQPDTVGPDTLRPDSTRPDTVQPDTIRPEKGVSPLSLSSTPHT